MHPDKKSAFCAALGAMMGKAVHIVKENGEELEGIVRGVLLEGVELLSLAGVEMIPYEEIAACDSFGTILLAKEEPRVREGEALLSEIENGTRESLIKKLSVPAFYKEAGLSAEEAAEVRARAVAFRYPWKSEPLSVAMRYRALLKDLMRPELAVELYIRAIEGDEPRKETAILELLRAFVRMQAYEEVIETYQKYESLLGEEPYDHMQSYATAIGYVEGEEALSAFLEAHPGLLGHSTNRFYFDKLLKTLHAARERKVIEKLLRDAPRVQPNAFEAAILSGNVHRARQLAANIQSMQKMGYAQVEEIEEMLREPSVADMGTKQPWQRACILMRMEGNRGHVVERTLLEEGHESGARAALLLVYAREKAYEKVLLLYRDMENAAFDQTCAGFIANDALGNEEEAAAILEKSPEIFADPDVCLAILASGGKYGEAAEGIARAVQEKAAALEGGNDFEKALIAGDIEKIRALAADDAALSAFGYAEEEILHIQETAKKPFPELRNDLSASRRLRAFIGGKGLLALSYLCRYATEQNTGEILQLMEMGGLSEWGILFFETRRNIAEGQGAACTAYTAMLLASADPAASLSKIEPLLGLVYDRELLEKVYTVCVSAGNKELEARVREMLGAYKPNVFEEAVISGVNYKLLGKDKALLLSLGYTEEESEYIYTVCESAPKGSGEAEIGRRLYYMQKNKNGLAERYLEPYATEIDWAAKEMFCIYTESERYEEAVALYKKTGSVLETFGDIHGKYLDALYFTGERDAFIAAYREERSGRARRHLPMYAVMLLEAEDEALMEILPTVQSVGHKGTYKAVWETLLSSLMQKKMYKEAAAILCFFFHHTVRSGVQADVFPLLVKAAPTIEEKNAIIEAAISENLYFTLPAYWIMQEENHERRPEAENWCAEQIAALQDRESVPESLYDFLEMLFPHKKTDILEGKFLQLLGGESPHTGAAAFLTKLFRDGEHAMLRRMLPHLGEKAVSPLILSALCEIFCADVLCEEILMLLSGNVKEAPEEVYSFFAEHVNFLLYKNQLGADVLSDIREGYMQYAAAEGTETALRALYAFLRDTDHADAPILAAFMMHNSRIWQSHESRANFESLYKGQYETAKTALSTVFSALLSDKDPEKAYAFLEKWNPFTNWRIDEALRMLTRAGHDGESTEIVCSMAAACREADAWRRLLEIYRHKGVETEGNILYLIAKCSSRPDDLQSVQGFSKNKSLPHLHAYVSLLAAWCARKDEKEVWKSAQNLLSFTESGEEITPQFFDHAVRMARRVLLENAEAVSLLHAVRALAIHGGYIKAYQEGLSDVLLAKPSCLFAFYLEVALQYPEEGEILNAVEAGIRNNVPEETPGKAFVLHVAENRARLFEDPALFAAARAIAPMGTCFNVKRMVSFIVDAVTDDAPGGIETAICALSELRLYFKDSGLLSEAAYYILGALGAREEHVQECYRALANYLANVKSDPRVFVHYVKRLYAGLQYVTAKGIDIPDAPTSTDALYAFFDARCDDAARREELEDFVHRTAVLCADREVYETLLLCALFGSWHPFIEKVDPARLSEREIVEIDFFISNVGRENLLRCAAVSEKWENIKGFLTETECLMVEAAREAADTEEARRLATRYMRFTPLDKMSEEEVLDRILAVLMPTDFEALLPMLRVLIPDRILLPHCRELPSAFLEAAVSVILRQKGTVPQLLMQKSYRDFVHEFCDILFARGMYKEASPLFSMLFYSDYDAEQYDPKNTVGTVVHATRRQYMKICDLMCREPEEVEKLKTRTEHQKLINIFTVLFSSSRIYDVARIEPLLTKLQKKLCVAVFFAMKGEFDEFEQLVADIQTENSAMGEILFRFGEFRFRGADQKARCRRYIQKLQGEDGEDERLFFVVPRASRALPYFRIFETIDLENDGSEAYASGAAQTLSEEQVQTGLGVETFLSLSYVQGLLSAVEVSAEASSAMDAIARFADAADMENAVAVLKTADFREVSPSALLEFSGSFAVCAYKYLRQNPTDENEKYISEIFKTLSGVSAISPQMANILSGNLTAQLGEIDSFSAARKCIGKHGEHLLSLLASADSADAVMLLDTIRLYIQTVDKITEIPPYWDEGKKIKEVEKYANEIQKKGASLEDEIAEELLGNLLYILEGEIEELRTVPLFKLYLDETPVSEGIPLTGYVENYGQATAYDVELLFKTQDGQSEAICMQKLHGGQEAPFVFHLPAASPDTEIGFTAQITYTFTKDGEPDGEATGRRKSLGAHTVRILPKTEYALYLLGDTAIPVEKIEEQFVGRTSEVQNFRNEFYITKEIGGQLQAVPRPAEEVPTMVINGPKRVGKSSLLHYLEKMVLEMPDTWACTYFDPMANDSVEGIFVDGFVSAWEKRYGKITDCEAYARILETVPTGEFSATVLEKFYRAFRDAFAPGRKILYIIDEFEKVMQLMEPQKLFDILQYAIKNLNDVISFAICGADDLIGVMFEREKDTQFFQLAKSFRVGRMPKAEYEMLVGAFSDRTKLLPDAKACEALWTLTRGQVFYTQRVFNKLVDLYRAYPVLGTRRHVHMYDVYMAFGILKQDGATFVGLTTMFDAYNTGEREVISTIAKYAMAPNTGVSRNLLSRKLAEVDVDKALSRLITRGFIELVDAEYRFTSEMYRVVFGNYAPEALYFR